MNLYYKNEAIDWTEALPIGNSKLGAMVFGKMQNEIIELNEITLWSGYKQDADNEECASHMNEIRNAIFKKEYKKAEILSEKYMICKGRGTGAGGSIEDLEYDLPYGYFQTGGELHLDFKPFSYTDYKRTLDIETGVAKVNTNEQTRECFCSFNENVTVCKITKNVNLTASFSREKVEIQAVDNSLIINGVMNNGKGLSFTTIIKFISETGSIKCVNNTVEISNSENLYIYITTATTMFSSENPLFVCQNTINNAIKKGYSTLLLENTKYMKSIMSRVSLNVPCENLEHLTTTERLLKMREGKDDNELVVLLFQFGRYLQMCSSRDSLPANLQGIWTHDMKSAWNGDYHININLQMNYWANDATNLSEFYIPYFKYLKSLLKSGEKTAKTQYNCKGFVAHTVANPWGFTSPGEHPSWGSFVCGGAWCCTHILEHYRYTNDIEFLKEYYPLLKKSAEFFKDFLVLDPNTGYMVTAPSNSPELSYRDPITNEAVSICAGPTMDNSILYALFSDIKECSEILKIDTEFADSIIKLRDKLPPIKIGKYNRIMEWQEDFEETEIGHRHMSPLIGLHPLNLITKSKTPELFDGCVAFVSRRLNNGGAPTGWSKAWCINLFARLFYGDEALDMLNSLLKNSTQNNMFNTHPPFQIDGNFGSTAGVCEMLIQSQEGFINILPALPKKWEEKGSFSGLCARGGFVVDIKWENKSVIYCNVLSKNGNPLKIFINNKMKSFTTKKDETIKVI